MLDWLFGSKVGEKKEEKKQENSENKLGADEKWVYDYVRQYLTSPIWRNPILDLIQQNCLLFQDTEENKFQYTKIFQEFTGLAALLLQTMIEETGITEKTLEKCIIKGIRSEKDHKIFQQILLCDNFLAFKKIMIAKNKELEIEALKKISQDVKSESNEQKIIIDQKQLERIEIEKAIAMSMAVHEKAQSQEEKQLEEALRLSEISYEKEEIKKKEEMVKEEIVKEEPVKKSNLLGELPPLVLGTSKSYKPIEQYKQQEKQLNKQIELLKQKQEERQKKAADEQENSEERKKRLMEQRQLIKKKKQEERQVELNTFVQNKSGSTEVKVSEEEMQRRRNLMKKLKEQLKQ